MSTSQYAGSFREGIGRGQVIALAVMLIGAIACGFLFFGKSGLVLLGGLAGYGLALRKGFKSLEGMNGDISGYALTVGELCAVAVYALV